MALLNGFFGVLLIAVVLWLAERFRELAPVLPVPSPSALEAGALVVAALGLLTWWRLRRRWLTAAIPELAISIGGSPRSRAASTTRR